MASQKVNLDQSQRLDITIRKGDSMSLSVTLKDSAGVAVPIITNGYTFRMQVRKKHRQVSSQLPVATSANYPFLTALSGSVLNINVPVINIAATDTGTITITLPSTATSSITAGAYLYDLQYEDPSTSVDTVKTILKGNFLVNPDVSGTTLQGGYST
mgnify:CR=1 FL=1